MPVFTPGESIVASRRRKALSSRLLVHDTFTRGDSVLTIGSAETGQTYEEVNQPWGIDDGRARYTTTATNQAMAVVDAGAANVRIKCTFTTSSTNSNAGFDARHIDDLNGFNLQFVNVGATVGLYLNRKVAGVDNFILSTPVMVGAVGLATTYRVDWTINGLSHVVKVDGVVVIDGSDSSSVLDNATKHGLWMFGAGGATDSGEARWDDLIISAAP